MVAKNMVLVFICALSWSFYSSSYGMHAQLRNLAEEPAVLVCMKRLALVGSALGVGSILYNFYYRGVVDPLDITFLISCDLMHIRVAAIEEEQRHQEG